jgi:hypothetical protein
MAGSPSVMCVLPGLAVDQANVLSQVLCCRNGLAPGTRSFRAKKHDVMILSPR